MLRNGMYADPIADWVPSIVKMGTIPYPTGDGRCAYVTRDDIARAAAAALTTDGHENRVYNLTGPTALSTSDLREIVARVTGNPIKYRDATGEQYIETCRQENEPNAFTLVLLSLYHAIRDGLLDIVSNDVETLTGKPAESFEQYLTRRIVERS